MFNSLTYLMYSMVSIIIFLSGLFGIVVNRTNLVIMLMCIEVMLLGVNLYFVFISYLLDDILGFLFVFFILTVAAAESAIGLAIIVSFYRSRSTIEIGSLEMLRH